MRQVRPRTTHPALAREPDITPIMVDLREEGHTPSVEELRVQLAQAKHAVRQVTRQLAILIDERDALRRRFEAALPAETEVEDHSIVPWGFYDDEAV